MVTPRILHLTLHRRFFDMIAAGLKPAEYRVDKPYWRTRLLNSDLTPKEFDIVRFTNGYGKHCPTMDVQWAGYSYGEGKVEWGAEQGEQYLTTWLGEILSMKNYKIEGMVMDAVAQFKTL